MQYWESLKLTEDVSVMCGTLPFRYITFLHLDNGIKKTQVTSTLNRRELTAIHCTESTGIKSKVHVFSKMSTQTQNLT